MSQRAARRRQERASRSTQGQGGRFNPRLMAVATVVLAAVLIFGVWYSTRGNRSDVDPDVAGSVLAGALTMGSEDAPVTVVEFGDYKCPGCRIFDELIFPVLHEEYIEPGLVRFQFIHFPFLGPDSVTAAVAVKAVQQQDPEAAWNLHHALFANQGSQNVQWATRAYVAELARQVAPDIDHDQLAEDLSDRDISGAVRRESDYTRRLGVNATPSLMVNGQLVEGPNYEDLRQAIEEALAETGGGSGDAPADEADADGGDAGAAEDAGDTVDGGEEPAIDDVAEN